MHKRPIFGGLIFVLGIMIGSCRPAQPAATPAPTTPTPVSISVEGGSLQLLQAKLQRSYQTHYLMIYPPDDQRFLQVNAVLEGIDPAENWLQDSVLLDQSGAMTAAEHVRRRLAGTDYAYRVGEDFSFIYELFFLVGPDFDPAAASLVLPSGPIARVDGLLRTEEQAGSAGAFEPSPGSVLSGTDNVASGPQSVVSGGSSNHAGATHSMVGGGQLNTASAAHAAVAAGRENQATSPFSSVGGGYANLAGGREAAVAGGSRNTASGRSAAVTGGVQNTAAADASFIGGGANNLAAGEYAAVAGGTRNAAIGNAAAIAGGAGNAADGDQAVVGGGLNNRADGGYSSISGGLQNQASGMFSSVLGGEGNVAAGDHSLAAGHRAIVASQHPGAIVVSDSTDLDFRSIAPNEFAVRATGGIRLVSAVDGVGSPQAGVWLAPGSGSWSMLSDRAGKIDLAAVDTDEILQAVTELPLYSWRYRTQSESVRHLGPTAQDFADGFGLGEDRQHISSVDADGVALASIQALAEAVRTQQMQLEESNRRLDLLEGQLKEMHTGGMGSGLQLTLMLLVAAAMGSLTTLAAARLRANRAGRSNSAI